MNHWTLILWYQMSATLLLICLLGLWSQPRIVDAREDNDSEPKYPWFATLYDISNRTSDNRYRIVCGGSLISNRWIITASNGCLDQIKDPYQNLRISLGNRDMSPTTLINITEIIEHPNSDTSADSLEPNNLALLKLGNPVSNRYLNLAPSCESNLIKRVQLLRYSHSKHDINKEILYHTWAQVVKDGPCNGGILCTNNFKTIENARDSGGPVQYSHNGEWYLMGVMHRPQHIKRFFLFDDLWVDIHEQISHHLEFIKKHTGIVPIQLDQYFC